MSDWKDELRKIYFSIDGDDTKKAQPIIDFIESLLSKQLEELVEKVEGLKSVELPDGQIIISKDQVIALIKDTNEVVEEEEKNK